MVDCGTTADMFDREAPDLDRATRAVTPTMPPSRDRSSRISCTSLAERLVSSQRSLRTVARTTSTLRSQPSVGTRRAATPRTAAGTSGGRAEMGPVSSAGMLTVTALSRRACRHRTNRTTKAAGQSSGCALTVAHNVCSVLLLEEALHLHTVEPVDVNLDQTLVPEPLRR